MKRFLPLLGLAFALCLSPAAAQMSGLMVPNSGSGGGSGGGSVGVGSALLGASPLQELQTDSAGNLTQVPRHTIDVTTVGMKGDSVTDNVPFVAALMTACSTVSSTSTGQGTCDVVFSPNSGSNATNYIFHSPFPISRNMRVVCPGGGSRTASSINLIFDGGTQGVVLDNEYTSVDGGFSDGSVISGCGILYGQATTGKTGQPVWMYSPNNFAANDGIIGIDSYLSLMGEYSLVTPAGSFVNSVNGSWVTIDSSFTPREAEFATFNGAVNGTYLEVSAITSPSFGSHICAPTNATANCPVNGTYYLANGTGITGNPFVTSQIANHCTGTGTIAGTVLTFSSMSAQGCVPGMKISGVGINAATILSQATSTESGGVKYGAGTYNISVASTVSTPQTITAYGTNTPLIGWTNSVGGFSGGIGLYQISVSQTPASVTGAQEFDGNGRGVHYYRLPAAQTYGVETTSGSSTAILHTGPRPVSPGDLIWADAFLPFSVVVAVDGKTFPQTITTYSFNKARVTHTSGSLGKLWVIPEGVKSRSAKINLENSFVVSWPVGFSNDCSTAYTYAGHTMECNGNSWTARNNWFIGDMIGIRMDGDNVGGGLSETNTFKYNLWVDIFDNGSVPSTHIGNTMHSFEDSTAPSAILINCNVTASFFGNYHGGATSTPPCFNGWEGVPLTPASVGGPSAWGVVSAGTATGPAWINNIGSQPYGMNSLQSGMWGGVQWSGPNGSACLQTSNQNDSWFIERIGICNSTDLFAITWNSFNDSLETTLNGASYVIERLQGQYYGGYSTGVDGFKFREFPRGLVVGQDGVANNARWMGFCAGAAPTGDPWHKGGDACFNASAATAADPIGWRLLGATWTPFYFGSASAAQIWAGANATQTITPASVAAADVPQTLGYGSTVSWNPATGGYTVVLTLTGAVTTMALPSPLLAGRTYLIWIVQGGSGSYTVGTWATGWNFGATGVPALSTTVGAKDFITCIAYSTSELDCGALNKGY